MRTLIGIMKLSCQECIVVFYIMFMVSKKYNKNLKLKAEFQGKYAKNFCKKNSDQE